jgi:uncharacterized protein YcbK (DUF882 family)
VTLSPHLTLAELACHDAARTPYPAAWVESRAMPLAQEFERVRALCGGRPIAVLSGYRTEAHNRAIGGARKSQHVEGRALDLRPPGRMSVSAFEALVLQAAAMPGSVIRGVGRYARFVHMDIRPGQLKHWTHGARERADVNG